MVYSYMIECFPFKCSPQENVAAEGIIFEGGCKLVHQTPRGVVLEGIPVFLFTGAYA